MSATATDIVREIGRALKEECPPGWGFMFTMFEWRAGGTVTYVSNANRIDMIAQLKELISKLEQGVT